MTPNSTWCSLILEHIPIFSKVKYKTNPSADGVFGGGVFRSQTRHTIIADEAQHYCNKG